MEDNLKILKGLIIGVIVFVMVLILAYYVWLINGVSKIDTSRDVNFVEETNTKIEDSRPIEEYEESLDVNTESSNEIIIDNYNTEVDKFMLDPTIFATNFEEYKQNDTEINLTNKEISSIAEKGFEESAKRIAGEGADNKESEIIKKEEITPNNYFTRKYFESSKNYSELKMEAFVVTRENEMGNGIKIYIDPTTGLIVGGEAYGD